LSTGLLLKKNATQILELVDDIIISLDGDEFTHDSIRNIPGAFKKMVEGIDVLKMRDPSYRITGRTVIHRLNFRCWATIIENAKEIGLDQISFLPADLSSQAFNREVLWSTERQSEIGLTRQELPLLKEIVSGLPAQFSDEFKNHFIAESPAKLMNIYTYYCAVHGLSEYPYKKCNAPWVSTVVESDGSVKPCFFHPAVGNINSKSLDEILNSEDAVRFRKQLDMEHDQICKRCVCSLNLAPGVSPVVTKSY
jgi:MoaA/NifB/PqqE/SkfB family radical SAM enzyme